MKIGDIEYQWVLLHMRNGEHLAGLIEAPSDIKPEDKHYKKCFAADLMQQKTIMHDHVRVQAGGGSGPREVDHLIELRNPHQIIIQGGSQGQSINVISMDYGDRLIFLRSSEVMYPQFLDDKSPIAQQIKTGMTGIEVPGASGEARTAGGLVLPSAGSHR